MESHPHPEPHSGPLSVEGAGGGGGGAGYSSLFLKLVVLFAVVFIIRALIFGFYIGVSQ